MELVEGNIYRRSELHDAFGGNRQSGISPCKTGGKILIFSNASGERHGYEDGWDEASGHFRYTGAGQKGDQELEHRLHNGRLLHHQETGDRILLFTEAEQRSHYQFDGELSCVDYEYIQTEDSNGNNRRAVQFVLEKVEAPSSPGAEHKPSTDQKTKPTYRPPDTTSRRGLVTSRVGQGYYRRSLIDKFQGVCAIKKSGPQEILIASHIVPWRESNDQERLDQNNGILLLPHYDALFDKHLISFEGTGRIIISGSLSQSQRIALNLTGDECINVTEGMKPYLKRHREQLR